MTQVSCPSQNKDGVACLKINGHFGLHGAISASGAWTHWHH